MELFQTPQDAIQGYYTNAFRQILPVQLFQFLTFILL